jgi:hypothetical protein
MLYILNVWRLVSLLRLKQTTARGASPAHFSGAGTPNDGGSFPIIPAIRQFIGLTLSLATPLATFPLHPAAMPRVQSNRRIFMKRFSSMPFGRYRRDGWRGIGKAIRYGRDALARMSPGQLLLTCIVLALAITILPLAIGLFVALLLVKLLVSLPLIRAARPPRRLPHPAPHDDEPS